MSREIKFEFIINNNGKKYISESYDFESLMERSWEDIIEDMETCNCFLHEAMSHCEGDCLKFENAEIVGKRQFTGLKDKKGVDIYEGDILEYKCGGRTWIREIIFQFGAFGTRIGTDNISHFFNVLTESETEIIGNIYLNPNLIESYNKN